MQNAPICIITAIKKINDTKHLAIDLRELRDSSKIVKQVVIPLTMNCTDKTAAQVAFILSANLN